MIRARKPRRAIRTSGLSHVFLQFRGCALSSFGDIVQVLQQTSSKGGPTMMIPMISTATFRGAVVSGGLRGLGSGAAASMRARTGAPRGV
jgi:hypothetical protein